MWNLTKFQLIRTTLITHRKMSSEYCLEKLTFCKVSLNPKSNRWWKFQLSILTNKKVLFIKIIWCVPCSIYSYFFSQQMPYCLATFLVYMALKRLTKDYWARFINLASQAKELQWHSMVLQLKSNRNVFFIISITDTKPYV